MYGVVNKSLKEMMIIQFGDERWQKVLDKSGVASDSFLSMRAYDDDVTYKLAQAAADELEIDLDDALRAFGVHWVEHTAAKEYSALMRATGQDMLSFLENLNGLHDRISSTFLDYRPPSFLVDRDTAGAVGVLYLSERVGLTPFVEGLLSGLASWFGETMDILEIRPEEVGSGEKTYFLVKMG
ncbi:MAG: heme NO-binding domain-containing protein [Proteobacteria bacterium]|nr:heme NO-binding domain-containing protein [Pseudomonadota bacterium]